MSQGITDYIAKRNPQWQADICMRLNQVVHEALPEVEERIQYSKPHYLKQGKYLAVLGTAKGWVSFTIFNATNLEVPDGLFESSETGDRKTIKIREGQAVDYDLMTKLVREAAVTLA